MQIDASAAAAVTERLIGRELFGADKFNNNLTTMASARVGDAW